MANAANCCSPSLLLLPSVFDVFIVPPAAVSGRFVGVPVAGGVADPLVFDVVNGGGGEKQGG